ncbi:hypothetical protein KP509_15G038900 [Ceratopteris richardii]|uniref:Uncharacterized protein n=1 Tax=Ceratopteris richardii TaxID=49495 RepID=A0A8T2T671_CERRI|nr:hypothetical protein KP509_15G038900 [Ceratopteris richardii]
MLPYLFPTDQLVALGIKEFSLVPLAEDPDHMEIIDFFQFLPVDQLVALGIKEFSLVSLAEDLDHMEIIDFFQSFPKFFGGTLSLDMVALAMGAATTMPSSSNTTYSRIPEDQLITKCKGAFAENQVALATTSILRAFKCYFLLRNMQAKISFTNTFLCDGLLCMLYSKPYPFHQLLWKSVLTKRKRFVYQANKGASTFHVYSPSILAWLRSLHALYPNVRSSPFTRSNRRTSTTKRGPHVVRSKLHTYSKQKWAKVVGDFRVELDSLLVHEQCYARARDGKKLSFSTSPPSTSHVLTSPSCTTPSTITPIAPIVTPIPTTYTTYSMTPPYITSSFAAPAEHSISDPPSQVLQPITTHTTQPQASAPSPNYSPSPPSPAHTSSPLQTYVPPSFNPTSTSLTTPTTIVAPTQTPISLEPTAPTIPSLSITHAPNSSDPAPPLPCPSDTPSIPLHNSPFNAVIDTLTHMLELCDQQDISLESQLAAFDEQHTNLTTMRTLVASLIRCNRELRSCMDYMDVELKRLQNELLLLAHQGQQNIDIKKENQDADNQ